MTTEEVQIVELIIQANGACREEIRDVRARDEQDEADHRGKNPQRALEAETQVREAAGARADQDRRSHEACEQLFRRIRRRFFHAIAQKVCVGRLEYGPCVLGRHT